MAEVPWTPAQRAAIETTGRSVLVSAGAGSGKTAVLAERCVHLVTDASPPSRLDRLLVVTFTEAAAAQMRERIGQALRGRLEQNPHDGRVRRQLALLDGAAISTIHAFCRHVLDRFFAQAGCEPAAPVLDASDARILRRECAETVFRRYATRDDATGERYHALVQAYGGGQSDRLIDAVLSLDEFLVSLADPDDWIRDARQRFGAEASGGLPAAWRDLLADLLRGEITEQFANARGVLGDLHEQGGPARPFAACVQGYVDALTEWAGRLGDKATDDAIDAVCVRGFGPFKFPPIPAARGKAFTELDEAGQAAFKARQGVCKSLRDGEFRPRLQKPFGRFSCADWVAGLARIAPHANLLIDLAVAVRDEYDQAKSNDGVLDFADLERKTLALLRNDEAGVAARLRDRYDHVLVDEFQDVNPLQAEILRRVSREVDPHRDDNLFAVGDVKQSIYRFRLAEPKLFLDRLARFERSAPGEAGSRRIVASARPARGDTRPGGEAVGRATGRAIDLVENFRSGRPVIDAVNAVFERLMTPDLGGVAYDEHSRLVCGRAEAGPGAARPIGLELHVLDEVVPRGGGDGVTATTSDEGAVGDDAPAADQRDEADETDDAGDGEPARDDDAAGAWERIEREAWLIARRIEALRAAGAAHRDMVILLRAVAHRAPLLVRALARLGVPVQADSAGGFFDALEVQDMLALLALLDNGQQDLPLAALLRSPVLGEPMSDSDLVAIRTFGGPVHRREPFHAALRRFAERGPAGELRDRTRDLLRRLANWRGAARRRPLADVLWSIYLETGYLAYVEGLPQGGQRRANLLALHDHARAFGSFDRQGLYRFLRFIDQLRDARQDLDPAATGNAAADVVRVLSVHRSKGLEFPIVFFTELGKRFNVDDTRSPILLDRALGLGLKAVDVDKRITYPTLPHRLASRAARQEALSEELRVLYVALTRARERLILVGTGRTERWGAESSAAPAGPLPMGARRSARCMLDWVMPAIAASDEATRRCETVGPGAPLRWGGDATSDQHLYDVYLYPGRTIATWSMDPPAMRKSADLLARFAELEPVAEFGPSESTAGVSTGTHVADAVLRRLSAQYPARELTRIPAVAAASELKRRWESGPTIDGESEAIWQRADSGVGSANVGRLPSKSSESLKEATLWDAVDASRFGRPAFLGGGEDGGATRRGKSTHAFLERVDLARPCNADDLARQLEAFVSSGGLSAAEASEVDLADAAWFYASDLGRRLRSATARVRREMPFVMAVEPQRYDPAIARSVEGVRLESGDHLLVRGIIDCLFDVGDGWEILDYKTDRVTGATLDERVALYRGQLAIYAEAVERLWPGKVRRRWLAFLHGRRIVEV